MQQFVLDRGERDLTKVVTFLSTLSPKKAWSLKVNEYHRDRTNPQNSALWGCAYKAIEESTGNEKDDLHDVFCGMYFGWKEETVVGHRKRKPVRTTTTDENGHRDVISTMDLKQFYEFIQRKAAELLGVYVPDPDPLWFIK
jgi:hypothetical protein